MANNTGSVDELIGQKGLDGIDLAISKMNDLFKSLQQTALGAKLLSDALNQSNGSGGGRKAAQELDELAKANKQLIDYTNKLAVSLHSVNYERELAKQKLADNKKETSLHVKAVQAEVGSYDELDAKLQQAIRSYKSLSEVKRESASGKEFLANIQKQEIAIRNLDKTMGNHKRNVGNYQNETFQLSQVLREMPAFTYSATTGILALSNNLPLLADAFSKTAKEAGGTGKAIGIFAKSIFSWTNAFTIAIGLITIFSKEIMDFIGNIGKANKVMNDLSDARLKGIKDSVAEKEHLNTLYRASSDVNKSLEERMEATNELQKLYPQTFKDFSAEDIALGKAKKGYDELGKSIESVAKIKAIESKITEIISDGLDKQMMLEKDLKEAKMNEYLNKGKKQEVKVEGLESRLVEVNTDRSRTKAKYEAQQRLDDFKIEQGKKIEILRDAIDKEKLIVQDAPVTGGGTKEGKGKASKESDRIKDLKELYEQEVLAAKKKSLELQENEDEQFYRLEAIALDYAQKRILHSNDLSDKERESATAFEDDLTDILLKGLERRNKEREKANKMAVNDLQVSIQIKTDFAKQEQKKNDETQATALRNLKKFLEEVKKAQAEYIAWIEEKNKQQQEATYNTLQLTQDQAFEITGLVIDKIYNKRLQAIDLLDKRLSESYENELRFINQSGMSEKKKAQEKDKLDAITNAKRKEIERERITALRKQARLQKVLDINQAIANAALAISMALTDKSVPNYYLRALNAISAGIIGTTQVARIIATPLPQYAKGRKGGKAEFAEVNERGAEIVRLSDGTTYVPNEGKRGVTFLPQGADVIPHHELIKQAAYVKLASEGIITTDKMQAALISAFEENTQEIKVLQRIVSDKKFSSSIHSLSSYEAYKKSNLR